MPPRNRKADGPPRRDKSGYYTLPDGTRCMSVTTIIGNGVPKPNLVHWAASEVAKSAIDNLPRLVKVRGQRAREDAFDWLRKAAESKRDTAANLGSAIHDAVESLVLGKPFPDPTEQQRPFLDAFERFMLDHEPRFEATEMVLANATDRWAGKGDIWMTLPKLGPALLLGDWKTGKGVYGDAALQLAAYRRAEMAWLKDGTQVDPPITERAVVVHLRPEKYPDLGYCIYPADTSDEVYRSFLAARDVALNWVKGRSESALGEPLTFDAPMEVPA